MSTLDTATRHILKVKIAKMRICPAAQRKTDISRAESLAANFIENEAVLPVLSERGEWFWIVDHQHQILAGKIAGAYTDDTELQCLVYRGLDETGEADLFLILIDTKKINTFDGYRIALTAGRPEECAIQRIVNQRGRRVARSAGEGTIASISGLRFAYGKGEDALGRSIEILGSAYNDEPAGFQTHLLKGMALVCQRYDGTMSDEDCSERLGSLRGGTVALIRKANALKLKTGHDKASRVAAAIVDTYNAGRGGKKLESWWK